MFVRISELLDPARVCINRCNCWALLGLVLLIEQVSWLQPHTGNNIPCITPGLTLQNNAFLPFSDGKARFAVIMTGATGHILGFVAALNAVKPL